MLCSKLVFHHCAMQELLDNYNVYYLIFQDVFVIDRLSILHIGAVRRLTGASILSTFTRDVPDSCFGNVQKIEHIVLNERR